jgi:ubiquinone/menaquinone biosynthesis C-methylase UbiE
MQRIDAPEILDSDVCSAEESGAVLKVLGRINRWFGGVSTSQFMVERAARVTGCKRLSLLEVAAGLGEVPGIIQRRMERSGIALDVKLLDMAQSHLPTNLLPANHLPPSHANGSQPKKHNSSAVNPGVVGDALALPFADNAFDLVSCNLFVHHLSPQNLTRFVREALRVSRRAVLINDLVRHPLHLGLVYASFPIMLNRVAWLDGLTSVRRSYVPSEIQSMLASALSPEILGRVEISRHFLYRMGVIVWKELHVSSEQI